MNIFFFFDAVSSQFFNYVNITKNAKHYYIGDNLFIIKRKSYSLIEQKKKNDCVI